MSSIERLICLDTETTGLDPRNGHRVIEIGCIEIVNNLVTGNQYHQYINPERDVPMESYKIHGLSEEFLADKPVFSQIASEFLDFIKDSTLVIHNAAFDLKFLNHELTKARFPDLYGIEVIDTLLMARTKFPGKPANLDALCKRYQIDNSNRELHGALIDSDLLAQVYIELSGGNQQNLGLESIIAENLRKQGELKGKDVKRLEIREFPLTEEEINNHEEFMKKVTDPIWNDAS